MYSTLPLSATPNIAVYIATPSTSRKAMITSTAFLFVFFIVFSFYPFYFLLDNRLSVYHSSCCLVLFICAGNLCILPYTVFLAILSILFAFVSFISFIRFISHGCLEHDRTLYTLLLKLTAYIIRVKYISVEFV